jgi:hypothetical protein
MPSGSAATQGDLTRLLGDSARPVAIADMQAPVAQARIQLLGVVNPSGTRSLREGLALIAVNGMPPRAIRVGAVVEGQNVLQAVGMRSASLGPRDGAAVMVLNLQPPAPEANGEGPGPAIAPNDGATAAEPGGTFQKLPGLAVGAARSVQSQQPAQRALRQTEQQLFHERQQIQFQQEQLQNQGPESTGALSQPVGDQQPGASKTR